ncbi:MAG: hypothetical protein HXK98_02420 [Candidatus Nanogingivalaceae bacterium]|nr:hypothetical protein [Candidatus Nanogingivalaceae bacterium]
MNRIMISIRKWPYISIFIFMVLLASIMWWLSSLLRSDDLAREVLINLSASFLAVIPTVIFIDKLVERHRKYRLRYATEAAHHAMKQLRDHHLRLALTSFRYYIAAGEPEVYTIDLTNDKRRRYTKALKGILLQHEPKDIAQTLTKDEWHHVADSLSRLRSVALEYIVLYQGILESEQLGRLLTMHNAFQELDFTFNLDANAFLMPLNEWAQNKFANEETAREIYGELEFRVSVALYTYLKALDEFSDEIGGVEL